MEAQKTQSGDNRFSTIKKFSSLLSPSFLIIYVIVVANQILEQILFAENNNKKLSEAASVSWIYKVLVCTKPLVLLLLLINFRKCMRQIGHSSAYARLI